jgi:hypothetical protein
VEGRFHIAVNGIITVNLLVDKGSGFAITTFETRRFCFLSLVVSREEEQASLSLPMPLTRPSVQAAMEFLHQVVPSTVFSSGSGRRRRRGAEPLPDGRRSDQAYLLFYTMAAGADVPEIRPLKSPTSIESFLQGLTEGEPVDCWVATQITQHRAGRDGRTLQHGFSAETARHTLGIVIDLDGARMDPLYRQILLEDSWTFRAAVEQRLDKLGVERYLMVRSGPAGVHVYIPLLRPDGRPLRASEANLAVWERVARGVCRLFADMGADANAVRAVQPFVIPGIPRAKHRGYIPYVADQRGGRHADLYGLVRRLSELKLMPRKAKVAPLPPADGARAGDVAALIEEISSRAVGMASGARNATAYRIAVYLLAKGAKVEEAKAALGAWNRRNAPPLSDKELRQVLRSAERCRWRSEVRWAEMQEAAWYGLRNLLELPAETTWYTKGGRWRPITPAKTWEERKFGGGREHYEEVAERLLRFVAGEGGRVELTQAEICNVIDTYRSTLRTILGLLEAQGELMVATKRGCGGKTVLTLPETAVQPDSVQLTENDSSRISSVAVEDGVRVGGSVPTVPNALVSAPADPLQVVSAVLEEYWRLSLHAHPAVRLLASISSRGAVRLVGAGWQGRELLWAMEMAGLVVEVARRLGRPVLVDCGEASDLAPDG